MRVSSEHLGNHFHYVTGLMHPHKPWPLHYVTPIATAVSLGNNANTSHF